MTRTQTNKVEENEERARLGLGEKNAEVAEIVAGGAGDDDIVELREKSEGIAIAEGG